MFDLTSVQDVISEGVACAYPEATGIKVFDSFYCKPPALPDAERNSQVRCLGRMLVSEMPVLARLAMYTYISGKRAKSNQLFKAGRGNQRLGCCFELLE